MKRIILIIIMLSGICFLVFSFYKNNGYSPGYYYAWNNSKESSLSKWKNSSGFIFNTLYRPKEFMALSELNGDKLSNESFTNALKNYDCCEHLLLKIFAKDTFSEALSYQIKDEADYYERIRYLNAELGSKTYLIDGSDTLNCTFSLFERTYKLQPFIGINLIYEKKQTKGPHPITLIIEPTIFNRETLKFEFNSDDLKQIPKLKI